jgi:cytochrome c oxidase assembly factor CtaG
MLAALATGYSGPPVLTLARAVTSWTVDPWALTAIAALGGGYLAGVRSIRRRGGQWPTARVLFFCGLGLGFTAVATMSFVGVYQPVLFYARSVQTILLLLVVPLFLALGRPLTLLIIAAPGPGRRLEAAIRSPAARIATFPAISTLVLVLTPFLVYFTPWYQAGFTSVAVAQLTRVAFVLPGFVFFWTLLRVDPVPKAYPYVVSLWITGAEVVGDAILGLAVVASNSLLGGAYYHALGRPWGPSLRTDQVLGGGVLWILGDIVGLPFFAAQLIQMIREDEAGARVIDAELDALDALDAGVASAGGIAGATGNAEPGVAAAESQPPAGRPWWESDPRFAGRFQALDESE